MTVSRLLPLVLFLGVVSSPPAAADPSMQEALPAPGPAHEPQTDAPAGDPVPALGPAAFDDLTRRAGAPPIGVRDFYLVEQNGTLDVSAERGVLANDREPEGESLQVTGFFDPPNGTLSMFTNGRFVYEPTPGYAGVDSFRYVVSDGDVTADPVGVRIDVLPAFGRDPVAVDDVYSVAAGDTLIVEAPGILLNDYDPDGSSVTAFGFFPPTNGQATLSTAGRLLYIPDEGFSGDDTISYGMTDGSGAQVTGEVSITVYDGNRLPVAADDVYYTPEATTLSIVAPGLIVNDVDPDGDELEVLSFTQAPNGTLSVFRSGAFDYTPDAGFVGTESFRYAVSDGGSGSTLGDVRVIVGVFGDIATGVLTTPRPGGFALRAPVPNPFNPTTELRFRLERSGPATLTVYDLRGRVVRELVDGEWTAGDHTVTWDGRDATGGTVASGSYVVELRSGAQRAVQKMQLVK